MARRPHNSINPFRVARALGAVAVPVPRARFGHFGLLSTTADLLASRPEVLPDFAFTDSDDVVIVRTFEKVRDGYAVDRFLADPRLARRFSTLCRKLGLRQPPAAINRRLLALRKRSGGSPFAPASRRDQHRGLIDRFGPAVEAAMTKLRVALGVSVDDIVADVTLGAQFESIASSILPGGEPLEYRLCALQIRKSRHLEASEQRLFDSLDSVPVLPRLREIELGKQSLANPRSVPEEPGIVLLRESSRPLYLCKFDSTRRGASLIARANIVSKLLADSVFWRPEPSRLHLQFLTHSEMGTDPLKLWELRLISDLNPAFNWPLRAA